MDTLQIHDLVPSSDRPNLLFEDGSYTLPELLESHLLPVVVQYDVETLALPFNEFSFNLSQPLLLYKKRNIQKVSARSLQIQNGRYEEVGESLLIPEDYKGWFSVLPRMTGSAVIDDNVPHFSTVEDLANSNTDRFLIGGTKRLTGLEINDRSASILNHSERHIFPGEIFKREKIFFGETKKKTRLFRKPKYIIEKFLMCRDEADCEVLLPFEQQGLFYQVSHKGGKAHKNVLQMSDIVARKMTPRLIKLVYGRFPVTPCDFTGLMRAESSDIETSVIACTLLNTKNILLELPVTSAMNFRIALTNNDLRLNPCYRNAIGMCAERANTYMRNIKVCVNVSSEDEQVSEDFVSKRNRSNSFDIDAIQSGLRKSNAIKKTYSSLKRTTGLKSHELYSDVSSRDLRMSESLSASVNLRPGRCHSTSRMSFCLGNSYLTVPMYDTGSPDKRNSGNNNSIHQPACTSKIGSLISFNGKFFEEETNGECNRVNEGNSAEHNFTEAGVETPPPLPCTNISSYVNLIDPLMSPSDSDNQDYIPATSNRKPCSNAPDTAPPPLPISCSASAVSSGSTSPIVEDQVSHKLNNELSEYAVPKLGEASKVSNIQEVSKFLTTKQPMGRRPSTFTFSEGCLNLNKAREKQCLLLPEERETDFEDDGVIYENITTLMEEVAAKEQLLEEDTMNTKLNYANEQKINKTVTETTDSNIVNLPRDQIIDQHTLTKIKEDNDQTIDDSACALSETLQGINDSNQSLDPENRSRKYGVVNLDPLSIGLDTVDSEKLNKSDKDSVNELREIPTTTPCDNFRDGSDKVDANENGKLWLGGLRKTAGLYSHQSFLEEEDIKLMPTAMIIEKLKLIGIKEATVQKLNDLRIDGSVLCDILNGDKPISECLIGINLVDQQKISMFVRGWRPDMDYM